MDSRTRILSALAKQNKRSTLMLKDLDRTQSAFDFAEVLRQIGGKAIECRGIADARDYIDKQFRDARIMSYHSELVFSPRENTTYPFADVNVVILNGLFGVAENGAVWITEACVPERVLPFICEHLLIVLKKSDIVQTMHDAYDRITDPYSFGCFIAGPSKTADIEQSLVLGAHGPKSMTVMLVD